MQMKPSFTRSATNIKEKAKKSYFEAKVKDPELKKDIDEFEYTLEDDYSYYLDLAFNIYSSEYPNQEYINEMNELFSDPKRKNGFDRYIANINTVVNNLCSNPDFYENCNQDDIKNLKTTRKALGDFKDFENNFVSNKIHLKNTYPSLTPEQYIENSEISNDEIEKYLTLNKEEQRVYLKKREEMLFKKHSNENEFQSEAKINLVVEFHQNLFTNKTSKIEHDQKLDYYNSLDESGKIDYINSYKQDLIKADMKNSAYTDNKFENIKLSANFMAELFLIEARKREQGEKPTTIEGYKLKRRI